MKYIFFVIFSIICLNSYAELPATMVVYYAQLTGAKTNVCRALFEQYDNKYGTTTIFINKPGADGVIAMEEMLKSKEFSLLCTGLSEVVFNNTQYPGHEASHASLTMVSTISSSPFSFITGPNSKYSSLPELLKSGKPIMVGYHAQGFKFIAQVAFGNYPVTWVPYKNSSEAMASIMDGSLDVYTDGGPLELLVKAGKLKSLGHLNGLSDTTGVNLDKLYPLAAKFPLIISITTSPNVAFSDIEELNKRFNKIIPTPEMMNVLKINTSIPYGGTIKESNELINSFRNTLAKATDGTTK